MWPCFKLQTWAWRTKVLAPEHLGCKKAPSANSVKALGDAFPDLTSLSQCWVMGELRVFILVRGQMDKKCSRGESGRLGEVEQISKGRQTTRDNYSPPPPGNTLPLKRTLPLPCIHSPQPRAAELLVALQNLKLKRSWAIKHLTQAPRCRS